MRRLLSFEIYLVLIFCIRKLRKPNKVPLNWLDPSMLIGFLCRGEGDWWDFRRRVVKVICSPFLFRSLG
jgi:hypothetical protein